MKTDSREIIKAEKRGKGESGDNILIYHLSLIRKNLGKPFGIEYWLLMIEYSNQDKQDGTQRSHLSFEWDNEHEAIT
jgi:hypothetical protein